jgi:hypothetical protein
MPQLDLRMGIGGSSPRRPRRQHGSEHGRAGATTAAEKGGDVVQRRHVELRPSQTLFDDAFQIRRIEVFGQVEDSSGGAGQADAVVPVVDVFWWHDRASMMHRTVYEPQARSRSADMQPNPRASSVLPDSTGPAATHDKHGIGGADSRARRKEGVRPHDVSVHAFPNNDQLAGTQHRRS